MNTKLKLTLAVALCAAEVQVDRQSEAVIGVSISIAWDAEIDGSRTLVGDKVVNEETLQVKTHTRRQVEYRDFLQKAEISKPRVAEREFLKVRSQYDETYGKLVDSDPLHESDQSLLEGVRLKFGWNEDAGRYDVGVIGENRLVDLAKLQATVKPSFSADFLNPCHAAAGTGQWRLPTEDVRDLVLAPGGELFAFVPDAASPAKEFSIRQQHAYLQSMTAEILATLVPPMEGTDLNQVRISISGRVSSIYSVPFEAKKLAARSSTDEAELSGLAIWNKAEHRLESITLDGVGKAHNIDDVAVDLSSRMVAGKLDATLTLRRHWDLRCAYGAPAEKK